MIPSMNIYDECPSFLASFRRQDANKGNKKGSKGLNLSIQDEIHPDTTHDPIREPELEG